MKRKFTKEHIEKLRQSHLGNEPGNKGWNYYKIYSKKERQEKFGYKNKGKKAWNKGLTKYTDERILKYSISLIGQKQTKEHVEKNRQATLKRWKDPEYREKTIKAIMKGKWTRPTSLERRVLEVINRYSLPYRYTGNGTFLIGNKKSNPDFVHILKKICVEVYGGPWHPTDYEKQRGNYFNKYGWSTIFINENEVRDEKIILDMLD